MSYAQRERPGTGWLLFSSIVLITAGIMRIFGAFWAFDKDGRGRRAAPGAAVRRQPRRLRMAVVDRRRACCWPRFRGDEQVGVGPLVRHRGGRVRRHRRSCGSTSSRSGRWWAPDLAAGHLRPRQLRRQRRGARRGLTVGVPGGRAPVLATGHECLDGMSAAARWRSESVHPHGVTYRYGGPVRSGRPMQRKPRCDVEVSTAWAMQAPGRQRRQ